MSHSTPRADAVTAAIGLGSNMGDKAGNIAEAVRLLSACGSLRPLAHSPLYRSAPWGVTDQDWFVNACVLVQTSLDPHALLKRCQAVENEMGRVRTLRWGPRVIDVDILTYGTLQLSAPDLIIPHPFITQRGFVLLPLRDVAPETKLGGRPLDHWIAALGDTGVVPLEAQQSDADTKTPRG